MTAAAVPPAYAGLALGLTVEDWSNLGVDDEDDEDVDLDDHALNESLKERMTALLLIRLVALLTNDKAAFPDMSSSTICRTVLVQEHDWAAYAPAITDDFLASLKNFVSIILDGYVSVQNNKRCIVLLKRSNFSTTHRIIALNIHFMSRYLSTS